MLVFCLTTLLHEFISHDEFFENLEFPALRIRPVLSYNIIVFVKLFVSILWKIRIKVQVLWKQSTGKFSPIISEIRISRKKQVDVKFIQEYKKQKL
ncbi:hypothetical protein WA026_021425 [Henosepilachna vigintioctopunctata]|uniref:Uncharacterized protein n=1 Tax=Henosepilachna vigintioctopunctata TaxID=420089 RepID=A0AAW1TNT5_9CUCU